LDAQDVPYDIGSADDPADTDDNKKLSVLRRVGSWLFRVLLEMDGRIEVADGYEGMQGKMGGQPPKWRFRWDSEGRRLPPEVRSEI
jgi:hypothetical protein